MTDPMECEATGPRAVAHERISDGVFALDNEWQFTYLNETVEQLFDVEADAVIGRTVWDALPSVTDTGFRSHCLSARECGEPVEVERSMSSAGGQVRLRIYPGEDGVSVRVHRLDSEGVEPVRTEILTDAAVTVDTDGAIQQANEAMESLFGYVPAELVGEPLATLIPELLSSHHEAAFERYLQTGERATDWQDVEMTGRRADGEEIALSISFTEHEAGSDRRILGIFRDVSERKERKQAFQRAYETFSDPDIGFDERIERLLGLGCSVLDTDYGDLSTVRGDEYVSESIVAPDETSEMRDSPLLDTTNYERVVQSGETLVLENVATEAPELAADSSSDLACYLGVPVAIEGETVGAFCFYDAKPRPETFSDWQVTFVEHLGQCVNQLLEHRRYAEQLRALNEINRVVHEVTDAIIEESTRAEIEQRVCEALAATDSYLFAWIGEPNPQTQTVESRAEAGVENYLDDATISVDADTEEAKGPTGRALQTGEVQTLQGVSSAREYEPWADIADTYGFESSAATPVIHEGTNYGVLNLYTARNDAFEGQEREMVQLLGRIVGHAIAAADRKQALLSDSMVELELWMAGAIEQLGLEERPTESVSIEAAVPRGEDEYIAFGSTDPDDRPLVEELTENQPYWRELLRLEEIDGVLRFEVLLDEPPLLSTLASVGGLLGRAVVDGDDIRMEIQLPLQADVGRTLDAVRQSYPNTSLVSKQEVSAKRTADRHGVRVALDDLTGRQLESLRTAYYAGYFEWPREASGEEVATLLDIASPTFSQHLRGAERVVFGGLFDGTPGDDQPRD